MSIRVIFWLAFTALSSSLAFATTSEGVESDELPKSLDFNSLDGKVSPLLGADKEGCAALGGDVSRLVETRG